MDQLGHGKVLTNMDVNKFVLKICEKAKMLHLYLCCVLEMICILFRM